MKITVMYITLMFVVNESLGYLLGISSRTIARNLVALLQEAGITFGHSGWIVMSRLWEQDGLTQAEISARSKLAKPNISKYIDMLEKEHYLSRKADPKDRRNYHIHLTEKGKNARAACIACARAATRSLVVDLTPEQQEVLLELLKKLNTEN